MGKRYDTVMRMINRGIKVDEKSGQKIVGWSPNNVRRLIICPDGALVQFHCCPSGSKYTKLIDVQQFQPQWIEQDIQEYQQGKYKSLLKVLVEGRICSCIEEIVISDKIPAPLKQADSNLTILANSKGGSSALVTRFPRLRGIWKCNADMNDIYKATKGNFDELKGDKISRDGLGDKLRQLGVQIAPLYEGKKEWWKGSYLRANIYNFDTEDAPLHKRFTEIREYFEQAEKSEKLLKSYEDRLMTLATDDNLVAIMQNFLRYIERVRKCNHIFTLPIIAEVQGIKYVRGNYLRKAINYHTMHRYTGGNLSIDINKAVVVLNRYGGDKLFALCTDVVKELKGIGVLTQAQANWALVKDSSFETVMAEVSPADMLKNTQDFVDFIHEVTEGIIGAAYNVLGAYIMFWGSDALKQQCVKRVEYALVDRGMQSLDEMTAKGVALCTLSSTNAMYCDTVLPDGYKSYFKSLRVYKAQDWGSATETYTNYIKYAEAFKTVFDVIMKVVGGID